MADGALLLESQVEQYVVDPLMRLCLPRRRSVRWQKSYAIGSGVPDYVILESGQPRSVIEVKLGVRLPRDGDWSRSPDFQQVSRYAADLDVPAALVDSNKIFLIERGATAPMAMIERRRASREDLQTIGMHLIGSPVAPPPSGPPEPRPRTPKERKPANRRAAPRRSGQSNPRVTGRPFSSSASEARHILLTWNPGPSNDEQWTPEEWQGPCRANPIGRADSRKLEREQPSAQH